MFVDASVIAAILLGEHDADDLEDRVIESSMRLTSVIAVFEATLAISNRKAKPLVVAQTAVIDYVIEFGLKFVDIDAEIGRLAVEARARYGKGTGHPAKLNWAIASPTPAPRRMAFPCSTRATISSIPTSPDMSGAFDVRPRPRAQGRRRRPRQEPRTAVRAA